jgi:hypothetical protein
VEECVEGFEFRIAPFGEYLVQAFAVELGPFGELCHTVVCFGHIILTPVKTVQDRPPPAQRSSILRPHRYHASVQSGLADRLCSFSWPPPVFVPISVRVFDILGLRTVDPSLKKCGVLCGWLPPGLLVVYKLQSGKGWVWGRYGNGEKVLWEKLNFIARPRSEEFGV